MRRREAMAIPLAFGASVLATSKAAAAFDISGSCKYKLCNCDAEAQGYDTQTHALAGLAAALLSERAAANKPLDASEIKLINESFTRIAANSKANRDLAQHVVDVLAAPLLP